MEEVVRTVPRKEYVEVEKKVPRYEVEWVERIVEVPQIQYVDKHVEVRTPTYHIDGTPTRPLPNTLPMHQWITSRARAFIKNTFVCLHTRLCATIARVDTRHIFGFATRLYGRNRLARPSITRAPSKDWH